MSSGGGSGRAAVIRPLMPEVPQQSAARTTSMNPRCDREGWSTGDGSTGDGSTGDGSTGDEAVGMTLLGTEPDREADPERGRSPGPVGPGREAVSPAALRSGAGGGQDEGAPVRHGAERSGPSVRGRHGFLYSGWQTPRAASPCEPPQGRKAARISRLWRVHGGSLSSIGLPADTAARSRPAMR